MIVSFKRVRGLEGTVLRDVSWKIFAIEAMATAEAEDRLARAFPLLHLTPHERFLTNHLGNQFHINCLLCYFYCYCYASRGFTFIAHRIFQPYYLFIAHNKFRWTIGDCQF